MNNRIFKNIAIWHLLLISLLGIAIYSNSLTGAFQFDDKLNIVDNLLLRDIRNLWPPTGARWFGFLTFSLNYLVGGTNPLGYHLVNTCIHILTACAVYLFVLLTFKTPYFSERHKPATPVTWLALGVALLFVAHPIQTQAVTYIVQRFASLVALLFMLSLDLYILARLGTLQRKSTEIGDRPGPQRTAIFALYLCAGLSALLCLKTKENAFTLPLVIVLYELMFLGGLSPLLIALKQRIRIVVTLLMVAALVTAIIFNHLDLSAFFESFKATNEVSRLDYLLTQFRVIVTYIRLLLLPINQSIDHHYQLSHSFLETAVLASLLLISLLIGMALYLWRVSRRGSPYLRLVSFGILWFFVTLSIESSIIPIIDVMVEHRLYLPSVGAIIAIAAACVYGLEGKRYGLKIAAILLITVTISLSLAAHARNRVWQSELTLWSDAIASYPANPRGYNMVGSYYQAHFRIDEAIAYFKKALDVDASYAEARSNLGNAYIQTGRVDEGLNELLATARANRFDGIDTGILYYNIAKAFLQKGLPDLAEENLKISMRYIPNEAAVYFLLGQTYQRKNLTGQAALYFNKAHEMDPGKY